MYLKQRLFAVVLIVGFIALTYYNWHQLWEITTLPDNIPIVAMLFLIPFFTWLGFRQSRANDRLIAELEADRARAIREGKPTAKIDDRLVDARAELTALSVMKGGKIDPSVVRASDDTPGWLGGFIDNASANPELLFYKLKTNAYKFSWALIPISVPFVWLLFPFSRRFKLYDHTVFVTYSLCFMMLLLIAGSTLGLIWPTIASLLFFVPPFHMYRQLKGTYGLSRWGALWRVTLLIGFAFAAIGMFTALVVGMGAVD